MLILEETGLLVSCAEDKKVAIWDYKDGKVLNTIQKLDYFKTLDYVNSLKILIGGNMDKTIYSFQIGEYLNKNAKFGTSKMPNLEEKKMNEGRMLNDSDDEIKNENEEKKEGENEEEEKTVVIEEKEKKMEEEIVTLLKDMKQLLND